jgi:hypothetical protein
LTEAVPITIENIDSKEWVIVEILTAIIACAILLSVGAFVYSMFPITIYFFAILISGIEVYNLVVLVVNKPILIEVKEEGIKFTYKILKERFVAWSEFRSFIINKGDPSKYMGRHDMFGTLVDKKWHYYHLNYEAATVIRKTYIGIVGKNPPFDPGA